MSLHHRECFCCGETCPPCLLASAITSHHRLYRQSKIDFAWGRGSGRWQTTPTPRLSLQAQARCSLPFKFCRRDAKLGFEASGEVSLCGETTGISHIRNRNIILLQHLVSALQSNVANEFYRREPSKRLYLAIKRSFRHKHGICHLTYIKGIIV